MSLKAVLHSSKCHYLILLLFCAVLSYAQPQPLTYYLPDIEYNSDIPTPEEFLGFQIGEWHISHDQLWAYCKEIAQKSDRVKLTEYARSHENRPLINLIFSSQDNLENLESIRETHLKLTDHRVSDQINIKKQPLILYQGYSIHGNEASGSNAAMLIAYYLAAGNSKTVNKLLKNTVVIIDPSYNPDGLQRFSTWVNMHRSKHLNPDPNDREFSEEWPGGRTNHYWFDLNRDWLLLVHPESQGRIKNFHHWKPNVLTDHHEMGSNSTFFFQPGVPERTNPNTPQLNQKLTEDIAQYHMKALDAIGSKYFMKERFDDFYYGKGSTYPDANGAIGILFEQASTRGHYKLTDNGSINFPFAIRNQVATSLSTQEAAIKMKKELLEYQRDFYINLQKKIADNPVAGYQFTDPDSKKIYHFCSMLDQHQIDYFKTANDNYYVPLDQKEYILTKTMFEKVSTFGDSIFYDVSSWTLPLAYDIEYQEVSHAKAASLDLRSPMKVAMEYSPDFTKRYRSLLDTANADHSRLPKIAMIVGDGVSSYMAGSIWHNFDVRYQIPITKIDIHQFKNSQRLKEYNTLIMAEGRYGELDSTSVSNIKNWVEKGGKIIAIGNALRWVVKNDLMDIDFQKRKSTDVKTGKEKMVSTEISRKGNVIGGAIFENNMDLKHPLADGYTDSSYHSLKKGTHFLTEPSNDNVEVVMRFAKDARASGYISPSNQALVNGSPSLVVQEKGKGKVIGFIDNPVFRGYWYGGFKLFMNSVFY